MKATIVYHSVPLDSPQASLQHLISAQLLLVLM